jgi:hypothetical protein
VFFYWWNNAILIGRFSNRKIKMKGVTLLLLLCVGFIFCKQTSMSIYYFADTTFINLNISSRPAQLRYEFDSYLKDKTKVHQNQIDAFKKVLNPKNVEIVGNTVKFLETKIGNVVLHPKHLRTSFFKSPNGEKERQGWILSKEQYPTPEHLKGDMETINEISHVFDNLSYKQNHLRVRVEAPMDATFLRDLMINVYRKENRDDILLENNFKKGASYSEGFTKKLLETNENGTFLYKPTMETLYDDFIIRQSIERLYPNFKEAWTRSISSLRKKFLKSNYVHEHYGIDITPALLASRPTDEVTNVMKRYMDATKSVRFNEFHGNVEVAIRRAVGMVKVTELFGHFIADSAMSQISLIELNRIGFIRNYIKKNLRVYFKYIVWNPESCPKIHSQGHKNLLKFYDKQKFILGHIENERFGYAPLIIPGDSVVWHQRQEHRFNILGMYNPSLINTNLLHFFENKWFEWLFFETYCPKFFPRTKLLLDVLPKGISQYNIPPEVAFKVANEHFPNGWLLKGIWDYNGIEHVSLSSLNLFRLLHTKQILLKNSTLTRILISTKIWTLESKV